MKYIICIIGFWFALLSASSAQSGDTTFYRWSVSQEVGMNFRMQNWRIGEITDELISMREPAGYWSFLNVNYNFKHTWGINLSFQLATVGDNKRGTKAMQSLEQEYGNAYYLLGTSNYLDRPNRFLIDNVSRFMMGVFIRKQIGKYTVRPRVSIGVTSFSSDHISTRLKEKGTNHIHKLSLAATSEYIPKEYFTLAPGVYIYRPISSRFDLYAQSSFQFSSYNFDYEIKQENIFNGQSSSRFVHYSGPLQTLSIGLGVQYNFRKLRVSR